MTPKLNVLVNYGQMLSGIMGVMQDDTPMISGIIRENPELRTDPDLLRVGTLFGRMCEAIKDLDAELDLQAKKENKRGHS